MTHIQTKPTLEAKNKTVKILDKQYLSDSVILLTIENPGIVFASGQHIIISFKDQIYDREYSIFSGEDEGNIQLLIKIVKDGYFTTVLNNSNLGSLLNFRGPHGNFCIDILNNEKKKHYLIATGTGIAPFVSFKKTYKDLIDFEVIHGVRKNDGATFPDLFQNYKLCVSQEDEKNQNNNLFHGRVTKYLKGVNIDLNAVFYLCGNFDMIYDVETYLVSIGVNPNSIFKEVYF